MAEGRPGRGSDQYILRFPDGMRDALKAAAQANGRSMNAEIVQRLADSIDYDELVRKRFHESDVPGAEDYDVRVTKLPNISVPIKELMSELKAIRSDISRLSVGEKVTVSRKAKRSKSAQDDE